MAAQRRIDAPPRPLRSSSRSCSRPGECPPAALAPRERGGWLRLLIEWVHEMRGACASVSCSNNGRLNRPAPYTSPARMPPSRRRRLSLLQSKEGARPVPHTSKPLLTFQTTASAPFPSLLLPPAWLGPSPSSRSDQRERRAWRMKTTDDESPVHGGGCGRNGIDQYG